MRSEPPCLRVASKHVLDRYRRVLSVLACKSSVKSKSWAITQRCKFKNFEVCDSRQLLS